MSTSKNIQLFVDGASRGNPGLAGAGVAIKQSGEWLLKKGFYLGNNLTNNEAEYAACIIGLSLAKKFLPVAGKLEIYSDSQLLVRQMLGVYRVKSPRLAQLKAEAEKLCSGLVVSWNHLLREKNTVADAMANQGIDQKTPLTKALEKIIQPS